MSERNTWPEWARYLAVDSDGCAAVVEAPPTLRTWRGGSYWRHAPGTKAESFGTDNGAFPIPADLLPRLLCQLPAAQETSE